MTLIYAATGHRPPKLGGYSDIVLNRLTDLAVAYLTKFRPDKCISGMALGWDTAIAQASINLEIPLVSAIPFEGQEKAWQPQDQLRFRKLCGYASEVVIVSEGGYSAYKMQIRNQWMVDRCNKLIALYDGSNGGTENCIKYAKSKDVEIKNLWSVWEKHKRI